MDTGTPTSPQEQSTPPGASNSGDNMCQQYIGRVQSLQEHCEFVRNFLDELVDNLEQSANMKPMLQEFGAKHSPLKATHNFKSDVWEKIGERLSAAITSLDGVQQNKECVRGWRLLIACVIDEMRYGFDRGCRRSSFRPDDPAPNLSQQFSNMRCS